MHLNGSNPFLRHSNTNRGEDRVLGGYGYGFLGVCYLLSMCSVLLPDNGDGSFVSLVRRPWASNFCILRLKVVSIFTRATG